MTIIVPHNTTAEKAIVTVDQSSDTLFEGAGGSGIQLLDRKKNWNGPTMDFSMTARVGFISLPISGMVVVDEINVTVHCELPAMVKKFGGEDSIRAGIERKVRGMLNKQQPSK